MKIYKSFVFLVCLALAVTALGVTPAPVQAAGRQEDQPPAPPFEVTISGQALETDRYQLTANVVALVDAPVTRVSWKLSSGLSAVEGDTSVVASMQAGEHAAYTLTIKVEGTEPERVDVYVDQVNGKSSLGVKGSWELPSTDGLRRVRSAAGSWNRTTISSKTKLPNYPFSLQSSSSRAVKSIGTLSLFGEVRFVNSKVYLSGATPAIDFYETGLPGAAVRLYGEVPGSSGKYYLAGKGYLNDNGYYYLTNVRANEGQTLRVEVCAAGANVRVVDASNYTYCYLFDDKVTAGSGVNVGMSLIEDSSRGENANGFFNIFDAAQRGIILLRNSGVSLKGKILTITSLDDPNQYPWSFYSGGRITLVPGDQWNDAVILRLMGLWVLKQFAALPPSLGGTTLSSNPFVSCDYSGVTPNLAYTQGWALFFSSAVRYGDGTTDSIDFIDSDSYLFYNTQYGSTYISSWVYDYVAVPEHDLATSLGNWCHVAVATAFYDLLEPTAGLDPGLPFSNFLRAARTRYAGHYPYNINQWWYGWTGTARTRSGGSLGDEEIIIETFEPVDYNIQLGVTMKVLTSDPIESSLWLPSNYRTRISVDNEGETSIFPYATYDDSSGTHEELKIYSPYPGNYILGSLNDGGDMSETGAWVEVTDYSKVYNPAYTVACRTRGTGEWWKALTFNGSKSKVSRSNRILRSAPARLY